MQKRIFLIFLINVLSVTKIEFLLYSNIDKFNRVPTLKILKIPWSKVEYLLKQNIYWLQSDFDFVDFHFCEFFNLRKKFSQSF